MSRTKKPVVRPNLGSTLRPRGKTRRAHFLMTDVSHEEHEAILRHCMKKKISISQFLADLVLQDAARPRPAANQKVIVKVELELTPGEHEKLELLARLHKKDIGELVRELLQPSFDMQRLRAPLETTAVRYYLSGEEHAIATRHMAGKGISARNYTAMLAVRALAKDRRK